MRIIFMGTPEFSVPALRALVAAGHEVVCVYSQPPRPAGRGQQLRPSPVQAAAEEMGLPVRHPAKLRDPADQAAFAALGADVAVVVAYGLILPQAVLDAPRHGCINIHASLLPRWRGAAPIHRAIMAGDAQTGVCIMQMEAGLDTGPVLLRGAMPITEDQTTADLHDALSDLGARLVTETLARLPELTPEPQPETGVTYASKIDKSEARIDWSQSAQEIARKIRGLSPFPGAWCDMAGERLKLLRAKALPQDDTAATALPGQILDPGQGQGQGQGQPAGGLVIATGQGRVLVTEVQREGKRALPVADALRGRPLPARLD